MRSVQSRFAETRLAETRFAETLTLTLNPNHNLKQTLTLTITVNRKPNPNPNFGESGFGELGRHLIYTKLMAKCCLLLFIVLCHTIYGRSRKLC